MFRWASLARTERTFMTDTPWAAREGDALLHTSMMAELSVCAKSGGMD
jgi:hypothetical protein